MKAIHPWAWWVWAIALAGTACLTTNPLLLALLALVITAVTALRRQDTPWARSIRAYFWLALIVIAVRVFFQILLGANEGSTVLFALPEVPLPGWAAGIRLGGALTLEGLLYTLYDAARLAVMLLCLGAANALANPRQALRSVPAALYEVSVAVVIALSVAPQLIESIQRVAKARRLRGQRADGLKGLLSLVIPVLSDAIERSIALAAGMQARGFGRRVGKGSPGPLALMLAAAMVATFGVFLLLSGGASWLSAGCLFLGVAGTLAGLRLAGRRLRVTRFNPPPWGLREWAVSACGLAAFGLTAAVSIANPSVLHPSTNPPSWPALSPLLLLAVLAAALALAPSGIAGAKSPGLPEAVGTVRSLRPRPATVANPAARPALAAVHPADWGAP
ncbi:MAG: energy-coupling factor transporter transmembrane protein EcfT [Propionibacteriaceae bacterium]|jgi:energy-coupling factor transport system permease protein|nr:energy-coupling factor transporter transmembrane protein EcfT [Propionibacteriaceae bacterium]